MSDLIVENNYRPTEKAKLFHASTARIIVLVGGLGSGKSYMVVKEIEQSAMQWADMPIAVYRKTMPALRDSTLREFKNHRHPALGTWRAKEDTEAYINGSLCSFRGLDDPTKAKSTNYAMIVMEEAEEFTFEDFRRLNERVRAMGPWPLRLVLVLNPVDEDHWIYKEFVDNKEAYEKAGGLLVLHLSTYDNIENLPPGYIEQVTVGMSPDEIDRYIHGQWGTIVKGEPVYKKILNSHIHLRSVENYPGALVLRGWDFGFNHPAVSFRIVDQYGRMNIRHTFMGEKIDLGDFVPQVTARTASLFGPDVRLLDFGDPRGHDKAPNGKETCFQILQDFGISAKGERGSRDYVEDGIRQVKKEFSTLIEGVPMLTIDPTNTLLRAAYFGRYVRDEDGKPKKDGYYEHACDADRYISHHHRHDNAVHTAIANRKLQKQAHVFTRNEFTGYSRRR